MNCPRCKSNGLYPLDINAKIWGCFDCHCHWYKDELEKSDGRENEDHNWLK